MINNSFFLLSLRPSLPPFLLYSQQYLLLNTGPHVCLARALLPSHSPSPNTFTSDYTWEITDCYIYSHENEKISYDLKCPLPHFMLSAAKHCLKAHTASTE